MDNSINPDLIAFAANLALAVNLVGGIVFAVVIRRLWLATEGRTRRPSPANAQKKAYARPAERTLAYPAV